MGMYDYLGEEQVKLFYIPIFSKGNDEEEPMTWHSGGKLNTYNEGDLLPLRTTYYRYPDNFLIYDYRSDSGIVFVVSDGRFNRTTTIKELSEEDIKVPVYGYYGNQWNIQNLNDLTQIHMDFIDRMEKMKENTLKHFPKGIRESFLEDPEGFAEISEAHSAERQDIIDNSRDWSVPNPYEKEQELGEAVDCYIHHRERRNDQVYPHDNPREEFESCRDYLQNLLLSDEQLIRNYKNWVDDRWLLHTQGFDEIVEECLNPTLYL